MKGIYKIIKRIVYFSFRIELYPVSFHIEYFITLIFLFYQIYSFHFLTIHMVSLIFLSFMHGKNLFLFYSIQRLIYFLTPLVKDAAITEEMIRRTTFEAFYITKTDLIIKNYFFSQFAIILLNNKIITYRIGYFLRV